MKQIISIVVKNNPGVLARVSALFERRGFNIDSLSVATTDNPQISRITVTVSADVVEIEQLIKQTLKLEETISVTPLKEDNTVARELFLVKLIATNNGNVWFGNRIYSLCDEFGADILDVTKESMIIELTGNSSKIDEFVKALKDNAQTGYRVSKVCRTGVTAMEKGV